MLTKLLLQPECLDLVVKAKHPELNVKEEEYQKLAFLFNQLINLYINDDKFGKEFKEAVAARYELNVRNELDNMDSKSSDSNSNKSILVDEITW